MAAKKQTTVTGALVLARMDNGSIRYLYKGDVLPEGVSAGSVKDLRDLGFLSDEAK